MLKKIPQDVSELFQIAKQASENAYAPYSGFRVGAAILTKSGKIFTGCNVENSSYSVTICAERTAFCKAVSENEKEFKTIAIYVQSDKVFPPCGACRQFMIEFSEDLDIVYGNDKEIFFSNIQKLLPESFKLEK